jgi:RNA polymerase sigma-70 factor (ECF subfamily)
MNSGGPSSIPSLTGADPATAARSTEGFFPLNVSGVSSVFSCEVTAGDLALTTFSKDAFNGRTFDGLVAAHERMVLRVAYRLLGRLEDAQDAAQEVFLRLFRNLDRIGADPKAWLYRVTVNVCNDHHRRRKTAVEFDSRPHPAADPAPDPERALALEERKRLVTEGLQMLPERERAAVVLRDIEGLSTAEVAGILGVEEVTVRSQVFSARLKLAKYVRSRQ